jgi:hypothetical protein
LPGERTFRVKTVVKAIVSAPLAPERIADSPFPWGEDPIGTVDRRCYLSAMNTLLLIVVLLLLFGGGGFYFGGPVIGGSGLGLILMVCLIVWIMGGFRTTKS